MATLVVVEHRQAVEPLRDNGTGPSALADRRCSPVERLSIGVATLRQVGQVVERSCDVGMVGIADRQRRCVNGTASEKLPARYNSPIVLPGAAAACCCSIAGCADERIHDQHGCQ